MRTQFGRRPGPRSVSATNSCALLVDRVLCWGTLGTTGAQLWLEPRAIEFPETFPVELPPLPEGD